jgi:YVTN family beta-propeller protein
VAVNPVTNRIYVANGNPNTVTVVNGATNATTNVSVGVSPRAVAVNQVTNKIYVANNTGNNVTIIDGTNNTTTTTVTAGSLPTDIAVNPFTNKVYVSNSSGNSATVITPAPTNAIPLNTAVTPLSGNTITSAIPTFTMTATSTYSPIAAPPKNIYFQIDTTNGTWTKATNTGSTATTVTATATAATLQNGIHNVYFFATDGSDATLNNLIDNENSVYKKRFDAFVPESSPVTGGINAYQFLIAPLAPTAANAQICGRVTTANGRAIGNVTLVIEGGTLSERKFARTNAFGYYRFQDLEVGQTYIINVAAKRYTFANPTRVITLNEDLTDEDFVSDGR